MHVLFALKQQSIAKMITFGFLVNLIFIALIYRSIVEINMFNKKNQKKEAFEKYNKYLNDYDMEKQKYDIACAKNDYNISSEIDKILNDYKHGCRTSYYYDNYSYKGLWENNTQNGFGEYMHNDIVLVSGNRKQNKYHGLMKIHIEDLPENMVANYYCVYDEGHRNSCYIKYKDSKLYAITDAKLNELRVFDFVQM
jgi:hypothetical protein